MPAWRKKNLRSLSVTYAGLVLAKLSKVSWYSKARETVLFFPSPKLANEMWGFGRQDEGQDSINLYLFGLGFCSWWSFWLKSDALLSPFCPHYSCRDGLCLRGMVQTGQHCEFSDTQFSRHLLHLHLGEDSGRRYVKLLGWAWHRGHLERWVRGAGPDPLGQHEV